MRKECSPFDPRQLPSGGKLTQKDQKDQKIIKMMMVGAFLVADLFSEI
jgi:hypothetical protein